MFYSKRRKYGVSQAYYDMCEDASNWVVLSEYEVTDILDKLRREKYDRVEESKKMLKFFESINRPGFYEAAEKLRKEIDAQTR